MPAAPGRGAAFAALVIALLFLGLFLLGVLAIVLGVLQRSPMGVIIGGLIIATGLSLLLILPRSVRALEVRPWNA